MSARAHRIRGVAAAGVLSLAVLAQAGPAPDATGTITGTVTEAMDGGKYTYLLVQSGTSSLWVATTRIGAVRGDPVRVEGGTLMSDFKSTTLNRTFASILFAQDVRVGTNGTGSQVKLPRGHPPIDQPRAWESADPASDPSTVFAGEVLEVLDTSGYTYVRILTPAGEVWAVSNRLAVKAGDRVKVPGGRWMKDFESPTLKRTFDRVCFAPKIVKE
ncbi:MAG: hypothetical protein KJ579_09510 [Verrucomicrobia bacterium]|nr:hypothetical protein [Verrucomicrobiota bacterium]